MKKIKYILVMLSVLSSSILWGQKRWTLQECVNYAFTHNIQVKEQDNNINKLKIERGNLKNSFLPNLNSGITQKIDYGRSLNNNNTYDDMNAQSSSFSLTSEINLFSGLSRIHAISKNKYDLLASIENKEVIKNNIFLNICNFYFEVLLRKEILQIAEQQALLTQEQKEQTLLLIENGKVPQSQLFDIQAQLADDKLTITEAKNALRLSILELEQIIELTHSDTFDIEPIYVSEISSEIETTESIFTLASAIMPEIKQASYQVESMKKEIAMARSGYYPSLSLSAGISSGYYHSDYMKDNFKQQIQNNMQKSIYITLSIPLFNRLATRSKIQTAKVEINNTLLMLEEQKKTLYKNIEKAHADVCSAYQKYISTTQSVKANDEALRYAYEKYIAGKSTVFEYNESKMKLANALSEQAQAKYSYMLKTKILHFYAGKDFIEKSAS